MRRKEPYLRLIALGVFLLLRTLPAQAATVTDNAGHPLTLDSPPVRIVSLVPSASEILFGIGAGPAVAGLTYHDATLKGAEAKAVVGGFFAPSLSKITDLAPDLVILSPRHKRIRTRLDAQGIPAFTYDIQSVQQGLATIRTLGTLLGKEGEAERLVAENRAELALVQKKLARAVPGRQKRVIRLMGRDKIMTPGSDAFQNDLIRLAGGIPPDFGRKGQVTEVSLSEWQRFNPEVIYGCGEDRQAEKAFFSRPGWKDVDAVRHHRIFYFPCELTCRAATHTGYFAEWLSAAIYGSEFAKRENEVVPAAPKARTPVKLPLDYVAAAAVVTVPVHDFDTKTLVVDFKSPKAVLSTLQGLRTGIRTVGNRYIPPPTWGLGHAVTVEALEAETAAAVGRHADSAAFLITGADMDNLSVQTARFKKMEVTALVTAGVMSNAMRAAKDTGSFYEPGTINVIILPNMALSGRAMARAIICATEAKTAALEDLDIRSSVSPGKLPATGTGTDNVLVVEGQGLSIDNAGGHTKMGELIARAVYAGVTEAVLNQNKITAGRHIFQRLKERRITVSGLTSTLACDCLAQKDLKPSALSAQIEHLLLERQYSGFVEAALALSDDYERGLVKDLTLFNAWCQSVAETIAGTRVDGIKDYLAGRDLPYVLKTAFNTLICGVLAKADGTPE